MKNSHQNKILIFWRPAALVICTRSPQTKVQIPRLVPADYESGSGLLFKVDIVIAMLQLGFMK